MAVFSDKEELIICKKTLMSLLSIAILHIHLQENLLRNVLRSPEVNRGRKFLSCHQAFFLQQRPWIRKENKQSRANLCFEV